ncbi:MAG TPA: hypothetical protein VL486_11230 [Verrucomicrobiae bacterium]|nr:hypothetical protein [Verrucomicrobiae bacterium]
MKANGAWLLCLLLLTVGAATVHGQAYPARINLTCITTNSSGLVKTKITEKDIIDRCATDNSLDPSRLRLVFLYGELDVLDTVTSNVTCSIATWSGDVPTNVFIGYFYGTSSNRIKAVTFTPFTSLGEGVLPADFSGTLFTTYRGRLPSDAEPTIMLKGTIQGASATNNAIYTGTLSVAGKPFGLPPI